MKVVIFICFLISSLAFLIAIDAYNQVIDLEADIKVIEECTDFRVCK